MCLASVPLSTPCMNTCPIFCHPNALEQQTMIWRPLLEGWKCNIRTQDGIRNVKVARFQDLSFHLYPPPHVYSKRRHKSTDMYNPQPKYILYMPISNPIQISVKIEEPDQVTLLQVLPSKRSLPSISSLFNNETCTLQNITNAPQFPFYNCVLC